MFRHRVSPLLASTALLLLLPGASCSMPASSSQDHRQEPQIYRGLESRAGPGVVHRILQTCTAAEGFTVTSDAFPAMNGCYAEEEVAQNGSGKRLDIMKYTTPDRAASFTVGEFNPYFGYKWRAFYIEGGYVVGDYVLVCMTNEEIMDLQPADPTFTWECDLDGDGTLETPVATDAMLSFSCGCDSASGSDGTEPTPYPVSNTPSAISTPAPVHPVTGTTPTFTPTPAVAVAPVEPDTGATASPATHVDTITPEPTAAATAPAPVAQPAALDVDSVCTNGLVGIEAEEVCCELSCGLCGGVGCGNVPGLTGDQCCVATIEETGDLCSITGAAPCRVDPPEVNPSTCPNGFPGVADGDACCAEACNLCGGVHCGTIAGTNGATDCCSGVILASGMLCGETGAAPCIMTDDEGASYQDTTYGSGSNSQSTFSMAPTPAGFTAAPTAVDGARGDFLGSEAPTAPVPLEEGSDASGARRALSAALPGAGMEVVLAVMVGGVFAVLAAART